MCINKPDPLLALITRTESKDYFPDNIDVIKKSKDTLDAARLVQLGARTALVSQLTGLSRKVVSQLHLPLTGLPSPAGQVPFTDTWYLRNNQRLLHANVVWKLFQGFENVDRSSASVLAHVYRTYLDIMGEPVLSLSRAYFTPRLVTINAWYEQTCDHCSLSYIGPLGNQGSICPACIEYFSYRCRNCGSTIKSHANGRRKATCNGCYEKKKQKTGRPKLRSCQ